MISTRREAIVVGLCAHGLDMVRALAANGVRVHALESNRGLPATRTRLATVHLVDDISGPGLVPAVVDLAARTGGPEAPVVLLTNDRMVFAVAEQLPQLAGRAMVSWARSASLVPELLLKDNLPAICARVGLNYPKSAVVDAEGTAGEGASVESLRFPVLAKPVRPMASFKAVVLADAAQLKHHIRQFSHELPILVQEWIPGDVTSLRFSAIYFDDGQPLAHFEGRKLDTLPRGTGTTTAAEPIRDRRIYETALRFFDGLRITGPVSLEVKEDSSGTLWVIEPTAFRTDYWAGCCIANGVNLPFIEYSHQAGMAVPERERTAARVWIDLERDPASLLQVLRQRPSLFVRPWRLRFTYLSIRDPRPQFKLAVQWMARLRASIARRGRQKPTRPAPTTKFDHGSDPRFLEYYTRASQSEQTFGRFTRVMERALDLLKDTGRAVKALDVVDVGCGAGTQALIWARAGHSVRAIDINRPLIGVARQRAAEQDVRVEFSIGSATELPYGSESADVVLLPELLEHVADWEACLSEAARVVRIGGLLFVSTSNRLCPHQQEFNLPLYSWYPSLLKRWCERKAVTTHPEWANHALYPAVNWFTYYELSEWLAGRGFRTLDRFDVLSRQPLSKFKRTLVRLIRSARPLRLLGHMMTEGTTVWALRASDR